MSRAPSRPFYVPGPYGVPSHFWFLDSAIRHARLNGRCVVYRAEDHSEAWRDPATKWGQFA